MPRAGKAKGQPRFILIQIKQLEASMKLKPMDDRVIVTRLEDDVEKSTGGIIIPDTAKEKPQMGTIIAVGSDAPEGRTPLQELVKEGDKVVFAKYGATEVKVDGTTYLILSRSDILAVVE
jgi:chaperonin GroES